MNNDTPQTQGCFKFVRPYMEMLEQLTLKAWNTPDKLTPNEVVKVRDLCSLTKCEASVWYLLRRAEKEKEREHEGDITGMDVWQTLTLVRDHKLKYRSDELIAFYVQNLKGRSNVTQHFNALRYKRKVNDEQEALARKILTMASELARLFENDAAFIFYLETGLTANAARLLGEHPLHYRYLIQDYVRLDELKGRHTKRVTDLQKSLDRELAHYAGTRRSWWIGDDRQWQQFIEGCMHEGWLCTDGNNRPYDDPYVLAETCNHIEFLCYVVAKGFKGEGVKPLRPGDERGDDDSRISCKLLAEELSHTFACKFNAGQVSSARKKVTTEKKKRLVVSSKPAPKSPAKKAGRKKR